MTSESKHVEGLALALPLAERKELARTLLCSLDEEPLDDVDQAWVQEAQRRLEQLLEGRVEGIPGERVFPEIERELGWQS